ncbi:MAG: hypothetical protein IPM69_11940 [Ignavibacteria bacterium]|nr:hypothetical protein [Ignavibacteria bacterium]
MSILRWLCTFKFFSVIIEGLIKFWVYQIDLDRFKSKKQASPRFRTDRSNLRIIKTARDEESINQGAQDGYKPLVKKVEPADEIRSKYSVLQNPITGEIRTIGDFRAKSWNKDDGFVTVIGFTFYYPYHFPSPFAAYLVPKDIMLAERVILEDLIEDIVAEKSNQGNVSRLKSCEAVRNGRDFELDIPDEPGWLTLNTTVPLESSVLLYTHYI